MAPKNQSPEPDDLSDLLSRVGFLGDHQPSIAFSFPDGQSLMVVPHYSLDEMQDIIAVALYDNGVLKSLAANLRGAKGELETLVWTKYARQGANAIESAKQAFTSRIDEAKSMAHRLRDQYHSKAIDLQQWAEGYWEAFRAASLCDGVQSKLSPSKGAESNLTWCRSIESLPKPLQQVYHYFKDAMKSK